MAKREFEEAPDEPASWMTTFSDLMTLLLTFFVLLFSMSSVDATKLEAFAKALSNNNIGAVGGAGDIPNRQPGTSIVQLYPQTLAYNLVEGAKSDLEITGEQPPAAVPENIDPYDSEYIKEELAKTFESNPETKKLGDYIQVSDDGKKVIFTMDSIAFFDSGKADIKKEGLDVLKVLAVELNKLEGEINIYGHTDNIPVLNGMYPSNWDLSSARATNVAKYLMNTGGVNPVRVIAAGRGEFHPIADNNTAEGRAKNRRVEIEVIKPAIVVDTHEEIP